MYELVCEGACNPRLKLVDAAFASVGRTEIAKVGTLVKTVSNAPESLVASARAMTHTAHARTGVDTDGHDLYACLVCGAARRFGR